MSTSLVLGNGNLLINIDENLQLCDFYFPRVGQENHLGPYINKFFLRINGELSEINSNDWDINIKYLENTLVGYSTLHHKKYHVELVIYDYVLPELNVYIRKFLIKNLSQSPSEIFVYFQNNFALYGNDFGDTAIWYPPAKCLVHYKISRYISIGSSKELYQFSCAARKDNENQGAYPDIFTGELKFNPISNGSVNSCVSFKYRLDPLSEASGDLIVTGCRNLKEIEEIHKKIVLTTKDLEEETTVNYWRDWLDLRTPLLNGSAKIYPDLADKIQTLYTRSLLVLRTQIDNSGGILAANDGQYLKAEGKDNYSYVWPRDAAYACMTLTECGYQDLAKKYLLFAKKVLSPEGYFLHKYYPAADEFSALASSWQPWIDDCGNYQLPIQEDQTALTLIAVKKYCDQFNDYDFVRHNWADFVFPMINFLANYRYTFDYPPETIEEYASGFKCGIKNIADSFLAGTKLPRPSYDIWETERCISTYTCCTVYAALVAGAKLAEAVHKSDYAKMISRFADEVKEAILLHLYSPVLGRFLSRMLIKADRKPELDDAMDSSLYAIWLFGVLKPDDPRVINTMNSMIEKLSVQTEIKGIARKENDKYNEIDKSLPGNPWFISTMWIAQYLISMKNYQGAKEYLYWVLNHADLTGLMSEQAHPHFGYGLSMKPLTWSHVEFIRTINMLADRSY